MEPSGVSPSRRMSLAFLATNATEERMLRKLVLFDNRDRCSRRRPDWEGAPMSGLCNPPARCPLPFLTAFSWRLGADALSHSMSLRSTGRAGLVAISLMALGCATNQSVSASQWRAQKERQQRLKAKPRCPYPSLANNHPLLSHKRPCNRVKVGYLPIGGGV